MCCYCTIGMIVIGGRHWRRWPFRQPITTCNMILLACHCYFIIVVNNFFFFFFFFLINSMPTSGLFSAEDAQDEGKDDQVVQHNDRHRHQPSAVQRCLFQRAPVTMTTVARHRQPRCLRVTSPQWNSVVTLRLDGCLINTLNRTHKNPITETTIRLLEHFINVKIQLLLVTLKHKILPT